VETTKRQAVATCGASEQEMTAIDKVVSALIVVVQMKRHK